ncbi:FAD-binding oxidoreductase [Bacillus sp. Xin]|uniref:NAD(P)/FAD-dependent oxidoreductase n=1 Tax=unclassified Bacillus (in: firmicutes) TaxID=185979 RepID=UPI001572D2E2|nr:MULTISPECIES: FAD-dependent oxidoreductase [unclassified Bacillus (in: firmicutes)]MBC6974957.1 FAD-binding oxidoreductase [Bacillus sp. Xin]NSW38705.1 FAD-binding oxidoreductase [Bacillus sp. Xin1]
MTKHCDVLIIGGGIIGSAIAYYVSKCGREVTLLERGELASGTSSRCDGNILAIDKDPGFDSQMSLESQKLVDQLAKELRHSFEYRAPGSILVCESEEEMIAAEKWVKWQKEVGLPFRMLDRQDIRQESPYFADDLLGGLECATDSTVNPYLLSFSLLDEAKRQGTDVYLHTEVSRIRKDVTGMFVVETNKGTFTANKVVNAAGVWSPVIGDMLDVKIPIQPRKGHIIVASRQEPVGMRKVMEFGYLLSKFGGTRHVDEEIEKYGVALVFEPTESQNFLIGSSRQFVGFQTKVDSNVIKCIAKRAIRFYPKMADMLLIRTYAGLRPWTADHLPIISHVEEVPGFYIAAGHEGDGISLAAITGKLIAEMIEGQKTTVPIESLSHNRFQERVERV